MLNNRKPSKPGQQDTSPVLKRVRKSVYKQALLAGLLIVLTVVVLFAVTAAWYTNIVQSSDLVFNSSEWGFEGEVKSVNATITASPGDEGIVELTARNDSDLITAVSLNISKAQMPLEIQKRIYFYADTSKTRNGEVMDRVYLGNQDSYTYMLFGRETLTLTEAVRSDVPVKWQWVYDVLGYYVQGIWDGTSMSVSEYLRPIEYDYHEGLTRFDANGNLLSIDDSTSVTQFLSELSGKDGYVGQIDMSKAKTTSDGRIYYPVVVDDATGEGVWAYLCTYSEIELNNAYDTELGNAAASDGQTYYYAKLTLSAQNSNLEPTQVSTPSALTAAIQSGETAMIQLGSDMALSDTLAIGSEGETRQVLLDLNGNTLTVAPGSYSNNGAAIQVASGSSLTMVNGTLEGDHVGYAIEGAGVEITLSNMNITDVDRAIHVRDNNAENTGNADSRIRLTDCTIETSDVSVFLSGNGGESEQALQLIVEDSTIVSSEYGGIVCNGSPDQYGTDIQVLNSTISGYWCGIYHPQNKSTLVIADNSTITGYTGLVLKGGTTKILDSTIRGTGDGIGSGTPTVSLSGFCDTGDAIYIESNYIDYHGYNISLSISGNSVVTSDKNLALRIYPDNNAVSVSVSSGTFSSQIADAYLAGNTSCVETNGLYVVSTVVAQEDGSTIDE